MILIVLLNLPNLFQLPGLARMYARDGVVTLRESPSTISSLVSMLVLIFRLPTNESESSYECLRTHPNRLRFSYNVKECIRNLLRINHDFSNRGIRGQVLNRSNFLIPIPDRPTNCKN